MPLTPQQTKQFRTIGHQLKPIVIVNGLGEGVLTELRRALNDHELIKIKINAEDREEKKDMALEACRLTEAELVQLIGNVALIYKPARQPDSRLSNLLRYKNLLE